MSQRTLARALAPTLILASGRAQTRLLEFFVLNFRNPNTRRAYARAVAKFMDWCARHGATSITDVQAMHVGA